MSFIIFALIFSNWLKTRRVWLIFIHDSLEYLCPVTATPILPARSKVSTAHSSQIQTLHMVSISFLRWGTHCLKSVSHCWLTSQWGGGGAGGWASSGGSRPSVKGGVLSQKTFCPLSPQFGLTAVGWVDNSLWDLHNSSYNSKAELKNTKEKHKSFLAPIRRQNGSDHLELVW